MRQHLYLAFLVAAFLATLYSAAAWVTFQVNNPKANQMTFWTELPAVMTWKTLPRYQ